MSEKRKASEAYLAKLRDPRWQRKRLEILQRDNFTCQHCRATDKTLHVHHHYYSKELEPWEYLPEALVTLCENCHQYETDCRFEAERELAVGLRVAGLKIGNLIEISNGLTRHYQDKNVLPLFVEIENILLLKEIPDALVSDIYALFLKYANGFSAPRTEAADG